MSPTRKRGMPRNSIPIPTMMLIPNRRAASGEGFVSYDKVEVNMRARTTPTNMAVPVSRRILANQRSKRPTLWSAHIELGNVKGKSPFDRTSEIVRNNR